MGNIFRKTYQFIISRGVSDDYTEYDQQTSLINLMVLFSSLGSLLVCIESIYIDSTFSIFVTLYIAFLYTIVLVFHHLKWTEFARLHICLIVPSWLFIAIIYTGKGFSQEAASLATVIAIYLFYREEVVLCWSLIIYNILVYLVPSIYVSINGPLGDVPDLQTDDYAVYIGSIGWIALSFFFFEKKTTDFIHTLKSNNEELNQKNEQLEEFTHIVSHDLQEPLLTISSLTSYLKKKEEDKFSETVKQSLSYLDASSDRMRKMIKGLLDHIEIGRSNDRVEVNLQMLVEDILKSLNGSIKANKATIKVDELPVVIGHDIELSLLFQNLIANAVRYRKPKEEPVITISTGEKKDFYEFSISDNGIGIDEKYYKKIFQVFQRLHNREEYEGTGIGLAHCKRIVERHGGEIWVESQEGIGSTFFFTLEKHNK